MENLEDLELEDMKALGLYIEKCVDEVLRSHLVAMVVKKTAVGRGRRSGKARVVDQTVGMTERASTPLSICLSDPQG